MAETELSRRGALARAAFLFPAAAIVAAASPAPDAALAAAFADWLRLDPLDNSPTPMSDDEMDRYADQLGEAEDRVLAIEAETVDGLAMKLAVLAGTDCRVRGRKLAPDPTTDRQWAAILPDLARMSARVRPLIAVAA